jgi:hypothetical protein
MSDGFCCGERGYCGKEEEQKVKRQKKGEGGKINKNGC